MITAKKKELYAIKLMDSNWRIRDNFLKILFANDIDIIGYYDFTAKMSQLPLIGRLYKKILELYYCYIQTNSMIFPLKDIEEVLQNVSHICIDPCPCRLNAGDKACDAPLFCCMRINRGAEIRKAQDSSREISPKEAIEIVRNARKYGLVLSLESCIQPYQNNICCCCADCCIAMKMRYKYGLNVYHSGPYVPSFDGENCSGCGICIDKCPVHALSLQDGKPLADMSLCLGCGICSEICPGDSIKMVKEEKRMRKDEEPGAFRLFWIVSLIYLIMVPSVLVYRLITGSRMDRVIAAKPKASDPEFLQGRRKTLSTE